MLRKIAFAGILAIPFLHAQQPTEEQLHKLAEHMDKALGVRPDATIAGIGTGIAVQHPIRIAGTVAPGGKVTAIAGKDDNPLLPPEAFDAILVSNTYDEFTQQFTQPGIIPARICEALKPGGTLVVVENYSIAHRTGRELSAAGFVVQERVEPVLINSADRLRYLVRAERQPQ